jgi:alpha-tubulin suppressor-like RCC1 family protein
MLCRGGACRAPGCFDGIANAEESDTDCGGPLCASCPLGFSCLSHGDCGSGNCESVAGDDGPGSCIAARCNDGIQNAAETGVDCGGPACPACADTENCRVDQDCASARCEGNTCISCQDRIQNADETDVDCGGLSCDGCGAGFLCLDASDCASNQCEADLCISCDDSVLNGDESAMDCGGTHCPGCPAGERCRGVADCASGQCEDGACISCSDGLLNGDEVEVDCGGTLCGGCAPGQHCLENRDCISLVCEDRACRPATCFDGVLNGTEGDIDCGANQAVVEMVSTGTTHTCALLAGGHIKCFGSNDRGQLGLGDVESRMALGELGANLARLSLPTPAVSVYAGQQRTCMIGEDGNIYCWGDNRSGRLGLGHARDIGDEADEMGNHLVPVPLPTNARASHLCLGTGHTCALVDGGQVHCWGVNSRGQLGYDDRAMRGTTMESMATVVPVALGQAAVAIGCGALFTCAHLMDGGIKCWGDSAQGQLGQEREFSLGDDPGEMASIPPINLGSERSALHVAVGSRHVCALLDDQSLKCWGQDAFGALGLEQLGDRGDDQAEMGDNLPAVALAETIRVAQLVAGDGTTCILTQSAQVFCWGQSGRYGTVGLETPDPVIRFHGPAHEPVEYTGQSPFIRLSLSSHHVCGRSAASTVHCWGWNDDGQLGTGNQRTMGRGAGDMVALAAAVPLGRGCDLCAQTSRCAEASQCQSGVCQNDICSGVGCGDGVQNGSETDQDCGGPDCGECPPSAACILNTDCSGGHCIENTCSTCGDRQQNGRETDIDCGGADCGPCSIGSACVSRFDCETFTCANVEGRQQCIERSCVDGILNGDESGMDCGGDCDPCPDGTPCRIPGDCASNLCTDLECTSCLDGIQNRSETSADCGGNDCAPCEAQRTCIRDLDCQSLICSDQTCAFSTCDDGVQNGVEGDVDCGGRTPIRAVSAGADHTCVIFAHGRVKCFGLNGNGNLGLGDDQAHGDDPLGMGDALQTVAIGGDRRIVAVEAGWTHTCALDEAGAVVCWGGNRTGQLGLGDERDRGSIPADFNAALQAVDLGPGVTAVQIAVGGAHNCALLSDGRVKCWGDNGFGQLGMEDSDHRGDDQGEMGEALSAVSLGADGSVRAIAAGDHHSCALLDNNAIKCWGRNTSGQLGIGTDESQGDEPNEMGMALPTVDHPAQSAILSITAGRAHTCILTDAGVVFCWGENDAGQLGLDHGRSIGDELGEMNQMLQPAMLREPAVAIDAGSAHTCAILARERIICWGLNTDGQLGLGLPMQHLGTMEGDMAGQVRSVDLGPNVAVMDLALGASHTCVLIDDLSLRCFGSNNFGQLGLGDQADRGRAPEEMGAGLGTPALGAECASCDVGNTCQQANQCRSLTCSADNRCSFLGCDEIGCPTCWDAVRNADETDTDCGGDACMACDLGQACLANVDCQSRLCSGDRCISCFDGIQNGSESDVDCGGTECFDCGLHQGCNIDDDCGIGRCIENTCQLD